MSAVPLALSVDFGSGFTDAFGSVMKFVPKLLAFLVIMIIGWLVAKLIAKVADRLLRKVGFPKLIHRSGMHNALQGSKTDGTGLIVKILYYAIMLMVLQLGFGVFGANPISDMLRGIISWIPKAIVACVIIIVAMAVARAVRDIIMGAIGGASYGKMVATVAWAFIAALGVIAALSQAQIATSVTGPVLTAVLAALAGVIVVGVGGGLVMPMKERWERWLSAAESESTNVKAHVGAYQQGRADAQAGQGTKARETTLGDTGHGYRGDGGSHPV
jgi:hypothetical protein